MTRYLKVVSRKLKSYESHKKKLQWTICRGSIVRNLFCGRARVEGGSEPRSSLDSTRHYDVRRCHYDDTVKWLIFIRVIRFEDDKVEELRQLALIRGRYPRSPSRRTLSWLSLKVDPCSSYHSLCPFQKRQIKQTSASCERLLDVCNTDAKICQYN